MDIQPDKNFFMTRELLITAIEFVKQKIIAITDEEKLEKNFMLFFKTLIECKTIGEDINDSNIDDFFDATISIFERIENMNRPNIKNSIMGKYKGLKTQLQSKQFFKINVIFSSRFDKFIQMFEIRGVSTSLSIKSTTIKKIEMTKDEELQFYLNSPNFANSDDILYPCDKDSLDIFIKNFEILGEMKDTGAYTDSIDILRDTYRRALFYYYDKLGYNVSKIKKLSPIERFNLFYSPNNYSISQKFIIYVNTILKSEIVNDSTNPFDKIILNFTKNIEIVSRTLDLINEEKEIHIQDGKVYIVLIKPVNYGFQPDESVVSISNKDLVIKKIIIGEDVAIGNKNIYSTHKNNPMWNPVPPNYGLAEDEILIQQNETKRIIGKQLGIGTMNILTSIFISSSELMDNIPNDISDVVKYEKQLEILVEALPRDNFEDQIKNGKTITRLKGLIKNSSMTCYSNVIMPGLKSFDPYWFQRLCIELTVNMGKNLILCGPTGGGKTHLLLFIIAKIIMSLMGGTNPVRIVFCLPTDQLVFQQFANTIMTFPKLRDNVVILTKSFSYRKKRAMSSDAGSLIIIGTPKELRDFFIIRDNKYLSSTADNIMKIKNYVDSEQLMEIDFLVIDEIHTLSRDYTSGVNTINEIKAIDELISCVDSEKGRIICASASLSEQSRINLSQKISSTMRRKNEDTPLPRIELVHYELEDIGESERPTNYKFPGLSQEQFPICVSPLGAIYKAEVPSDIVQIDITPKFILSLLLKARAEKVLPIAVFFMSETLSISALRSLIDYMKEQILRSEWNQMKLSFTNQMEKTTRDKTEEIYMEMLKNKILEYAINDSSIYSDITIPIELFTELVSKFNKYNDSNIKTFNYTPDLYAFLIEYVGKREGLSLFISKIHPFYNFGNIKTDTKRFDIYGQNRELTDFGKMLLSQGVDIENCSHLINLLCEAFTFGIELTTSSVPVAFQLEISKILREIKDKLDKTNLDIGATFCDYQMSMGVDYSFLSIAIIMPKLDPILYSLFLQMNGRCGRPTKNMRKLSQLPKAITFMINVRNALTFPGTETLTFDTSDIRTNFYNSNTIYENILSLMRKFESIKHNLEAKRLFTDEIFYNDDSLFPGVAAIPELHLKYFHMKRELKEMYDIFKVAAPRIAEMYIKPLFYRFQFQCYNSLMSQSR